MNRHKFLMPSSILVLLMFYITTTGCKKLVEVDGPSNAINATNVFSTDGTAASLLTAFYANMCLGGGPLAFSTGINSISIQAGLSADEFSLWSGVTSNQWLAQYQNKLTTNVNPPFWNNLYTLIYKINDAIEGISGSGSLSPTVKQQLLGEAKFLRGLSYFYLVNMYGDVPLAITTDYKVNSTMARTDKSSVWKQITADLQEARDMLSSNYLTADLNNTALERVRPTKWAATALLARAYLYQGDWANSEVQATAIISNKALYDTVPLSSVFLKNSKEAIWQLQPVNTGWNTEDAKVFSLTSPPAGFSNGKFVSLNSSLYNSFEADDLRKTSWVGAYTIGTDTHRFANKYKAATSGASVTEYLMVLRLGEQYIIRAEARAQQSKIEEAKSDLNVIRTRAGLPNTTANDKDALLAAILQERRVELFSEWGHRWFDLKRTGNVDVVMTSAATGKGTSWDKRWQLYPLPATEIQRNKMLEQNDGY